MTRKPVRKAKKAKKTGPAKAAARSRPAPAGKTRRVKARSAAGKRVRAGKGAEPDAVAAMVTAGAQALRLPVEPSWHASVAFNLRLILRFAAQVDAFALPDDGEPAPVYHA